jgi:LacI family transcriptional regulator, repressor for deo operon, udp, cdd, tsx, nupC, and nupG
LRVEKVHSTLLVFCKLAEDLQGIAEPLGKAKMAGIQEIAEKAGVSPATVSRALRGLQHVNGRTRAKIFEVADSLGYAVHTPGKKIGKTNTVGIIAPYTSKWFFAEAIAGIAQALRDAQMDILLYNFNEINGREKLFKGRQIREHVDALITVSLPPTQQEFETMLALDLPTSLIGFHNPNFSSIAIDDVAGARTATQHLINQGHTKIGIISGDQSTAWDFPVHRDRRNGFLSALNEAGLTFNPQHEAFANFDMDSGQRAMDDLLARKDRPTAVFCESDEMAFGAMMSLKRHNLNCPNDISIIGFDGHSMAEFANLTTVAQPVRLLGEMAAWSVMEKINKPGSQPKDLSLPTTLIVRGSTKKI